MSARTTREQRDGLRAWLDKIDPDDVPSEQPPTIWHDMLDDLDDIAAARTRAEAERDRIQRLYDEAIDGWSAEIDRHRGTKARAEADRDPLAYKIELDDVLAKRNLALEARAEALVVALEECVESLEMVASSLGFEYDVLPKARVSLAAWRARDDA